MLGSIEVNLDRKHAAAACSQLFLPITLFSIILNTLTKARIVENFEHSYVISISII